MTAFSIRRHFASSRSLTLAVEGEVDLATSGLLATTIRDAISDGHIAELIVDLDMVEFLDATGISALLAGYHLAAEHGVSYHATNPHHVVRRVLDVTGLLTILTTAEPPPYKGSP